MADTIPITEADLRHAIADDRYWRRGDPERDDYVRWVTDGYRALYGPEARGGVVHVRAYERMRDGKVEKVAAHDRRAPPGHGGEIGEQLPAKGETDVIPAQVLLLTPRPMLMFQRPPVLPRELGPPLRRTPNQSGKEAANDTPSFARGATRHANEDPQQFAYRVMNEYWGEGTWWGAPKRMIEFRRIQKFGQRAFRPRVIGGEVGSEQDEPEE